MQCFEELEPQGSMLPVSQRSLDRLYVTWINFQGVQCKMIGPETKCFCNHRFKEHCYLSASKIVNKMVHCQNQKCNCKCFQYIPTHGSYDFKCLCKHSFKEHDCNSKKCFREKCGCNKFSSAWTCSCGSKYADHQTIVQTYQDRVKKGRTGNDMLRLNEQLNIPSALQGSLLKPIKMDPQARLKIKQKQKGITGINSSYDIQQNQSLQLFSMQHITNTRTKQS